MLNHCHKEWSWIWTLWVCEYENLTCLCTLLFRRRHCQHMMWMAWQ